MWNIRDGHTFNEDKFLRGEDLSSAVLVVYFTDGKFTVVEIIGPLKAILSDSEGKNITCISTSFTWT